MQRVMVIGGPGAGKSTCARAIGARLGVPVFSMDREVFWLPGWQAREIDDQIRQVERLVAEPAWVFEGSNSRTFGVRAARADLLIWLDTPVALRLLRVIRRTLRDRGRTRPDMADDCPERLDMLPEFLWFILRTWRPSRRKTRAFFDGFPRAKRRLTTAAQVARFLEDDPMLPAPHPDPVQRPT